MQVVRVVEHRTSSRSGNDQTARTSDQYQAYTRGGGAGEQSLGRDHQVVLVARRGPCGADDEVGTAYDVGDRTGVAGVGDHGIDLRREVGDSPGAAYRSGDAMPAVECLCRDAAADLSEGSEDDDVHGSAPCWHGGVG